MSWDTFAKGKIVYIDEARKVFVKEDGDVDWDKVQERWNFLKPIKESLAAKYYTNEVHEKAKSLEKADQLRLRDIMMGGLCKDDSGVGVYATRPEDYDQFGFYLEPLIRAYHKIEGDTKQQHDWNIPLGKYLLANIDSSLKEVSMRARVARNVKGWNLPPSMDKEERLKFESTMEEVFSKFDIPGKYYSQTPGHANELKPAEAD